MTKTDVPGNHGEIDDYVDLRSVGSNEAVWHILSFHISKKYPPVQALNIHPEDQQSLVFKQGREREAINNAKHKHTSQPSLSTTKTILRMRTPNQDMLTCQRNAHGKNKKTRNGRNVRVDI